MTLNRRTILKTGTAVGLGAMAAPLFVGRASAATPGTLVFGLSSYPPTLEPWANAGTAASTVKLQMHRGLLGYDGKGELRSELAETWEAEDAQTYRFDLRQNAKFPRWLTRHLCRRQGQLRGDDGRRFDGASESGPGHYRQH